MSTVYFTIDSFNALKAGIGRSKPQKQPLPSQSAACRTGDAGTNVQIAIIYEQSQIYGETYNEDGTLLSSELIFG